MKFLFIALSFLSLVHHSRAESNDVRFSVGAQCITKMDIENRLRLMALLSNIEVCDANQTELMAEAERSLYQETLQLAEMKKYGFMPSEDLISQNVALLAERLNVPVDQFEKFLKEKNIPISMVRQMIEIQIYWFAFLQQRYPEITKVQDSVIDQLFNTQKANKNQPRYLLAEIFIPAYNRKELKSVEQRMQTLKALLDTNINDFSKIAQESSKSSSARQGGVMGWITVDLLPEEARAHVQKLEPGKITSVIKTEEGFALYALLDRRLPTDSNFRDTAFSIRQIAMNATSQEEEMIILELKKCKNCADLDKKLENFPFVQSMKAENIVPQQMPPQLVELFQTLPDNQLSQPFKADKTSVYLWICDRKVMSQELSRDDLRQRILSQNIMKKNNAVLKEISRKMLVDKRK
jgi:peptidyl-prolyl cis-trans isomerase SurA